MLGLGFEFLILSFVDDPDLGLACLFGFWDTIGRSLFEVLLSFYAMDFNLFDTARDEFKLCLGLWCTGIF